MAQDSTELILKKLNDIEQTLAEIKRQLGSPNPAKHHDRKPFAPAKKPQMQPAQDYSDVEGVVGKFDGVNMVTMDGQIYEVPANYAAKSKLVYGDTLKLIEEDGKKLYKHINKVPRQKFDGILTKKDGLWYVLTDRGSYKVSDVAAEFQKAEVNEQVKLLLPADNLDAPYATIDSLEQPKTTPTQSENPILSPIYSGMQQPTVQAPPSVNQNPVIPTAPQFPPSATQPMQGSSIADDDLV